MMNRIEQGKHILKMIEGVSVDDTDTLDEIDILSWCFFNDEQLIGWVNGERWYFDTDKLIGRSTRDKPEYTRSRNALKQARPDGWTLARLNSYMKHQWCAEFYSSKSIVASVELPTEELAELHAIIQAYIWKMENE